MYYNSMNLINKLNKYNQRISFNIFALNGYLVLFAFVYLSFSLKPHSTDWLLWFCIYAIITAIYLIAFIVYCVEVVTQYRLPFAYLKNKRYTFILLFGALISIIYLILLIMFFALPLFM